jgi:hypothetical protein
MTSLIIIFRLSNTKYHVVVDLKDTVTNLTIFGVTPDKYLLDMKYIIRIGDHQLNALEIDGFSSGINA